MWVAEVGRAAADPLRRTRSATRRCCSTTTGCRTRSPATCRSTRWCRSCSPRPAARSRTRRRTTTRSRPTCCKVAENVAQVFMGMRIQCAQCHNHPFDRWTMDDYYGFAAFFTQIGRKRGDDPRETIVFNSGGGEVKHPVGGRDDDAEVPRRRDARRRRARTAARCWPSGSRRRRTRTSRPTWPTSSGPTSSASGIIDPVDDVRVSNPRVQPRAARRAGQAVHRVQLRLQEAGPRHLHVADVPAGDAAQRDQRRRHAELRPRPDPPHPGRDAARLHHQVTETRRTSSPACRSAPGPCRSPTASTSTYFLTTFGRATRETVCSCEVKLEPTLSQALHLLNGQHDDVRRSSRATWSLGDADGEEDARGDHRRAVRAHASAASRRRRSGPSWSRVIAGRDRSRKRAGGRLLGAAELREFMFNH